MQIINFISIIAMPMIILLIVIYGVGEKNKVFDTRQQLVFYQL